MYYAFSDGNIAATYYQWGVDEAIHIFSGKTRFFASAMFTNFRNDVLSSLPGFFQMNRQILFNRLHRIFRLMNLITLYDQRIRVIHCKTCSSVHSGYPLNTNASG